MKLTSYDDKDSVDTVQAIMLEADEVSEVSDWTNGVVVQEIDAFSADRYPALNIQCGADVKRASLGDYIVQWPDQRFDVYTPLVFKSKFQPSRG